jgi:hypothetical protein
MARLWVWGFRVNVLMVFSVVLSGEAAKVVPRPKQEARKISAMLIAALTRNLSMAFLPVVFYSRKFSFEELNESATSARWTASRRRKSEV